MNAWYGKPTTWPPGTGIDPIMTSVHFDQAMKPKIQSNESLQFLRAYNKKFGLVGARDLHTLLLLRESNVDAFFSACATLSLPKPFKEASISRSEIIIVDMAEIGWQIVPMEVQKKATIFTQAIQAKHLKANRSKRLDFAYARLLIYAQAKLVITSRIHVALPCVAVDTPVIFIQAKDLPGGSTSRVKGLLDLFHTLNNTGATFNWTDPPPNPNSWKKALYRAALWHTISEHDEILTDTATLFGINPFFTLHNNLRKISYLRSLVKRPLHDAYRCRSKFAKVLHSELKIRQMESINPGIIEYLCSLLK